MSNSMLKAVNESFAMLGEAYEKEWKQHSLKRVNFSKIEDIAFVKKQKQRLFDNKRAIVRNIK